MSDPLSRLRIDSSGRTAGPAASKGRGRAKWPYVVVLTAVLGAALFLWFPFAKNVDLSMVALVFPSQTESLITASGYVVADRKSALGARVSSRLVWLGVEEGSKVTAGQVVAKLEDIDFVAMRLRAEGDLATAQAQVVNAQAELADAELNLRRLKALVAREVVAQSEVDVAQARRDKARAMVEAAQKTVAARQASVSEAEANVEFTRIRAPFDAVVLTKSADVGDLITPLGAATNAKAAVVSIADPSSLQVEVDVSETAILKVKVGQPCEIALDAIAGERFPGYVHMIVPTADRTKATVLVKVRFDQLDPRVVSDMSAKVSFLARKLSPEEAKPFVGVRPGAVVREEGRAFVFVLDGETLRRKPVTVGQTRGDFLEILSGLNPGEKVVADPKGLREGEKATTKKDA